MFSKHIIFSKHFKNVFIFFYCKRFWKIHFEKSIVSLDVSYTISAAADPRKFFFCWAGWGRGAYIPFCWFFVNKTIQSWRNSWGFVVNVPVTLLDPPPLMDTISLCSSQMSPIEIDQRFIFENIFKRISFYEVIDHCTQIPSKHITSW